jgi:transposase InsO family protein
MRRGSKATVASALLGNCVSQGCVSEQKEFAKPFCGRVCARYRKTYRVTTDSNHRKPDVGRLYLAAIVDLGTRRIVGWAMSERMSAKLVCDALQMAYWRGRPATGLLMHSDRCSQPGLNPSSQHGLSLSSVTLS